MLFVAFFSRDIDELKSWSLPCNLAITQQFAICVFAVTHVVNKHPGMFTTPSVQLLKYSFLAIGSLATAALYSAVVRDHNVSYRQKNDRRIARRLRIDARYNHELSLGHQLVELIEHVFVRTPLDH